MKRMLQAAAGRAVEKRRLRLFWAGAALAVVAVALAVPALSAARTSGTTITFVAAQYSDNTQGYWQALIKKFEAANPGIKVNLQVINWNDITQKVNTLVATHQQPDILNLNTFSGFARQGLLYPTSQVVSPAVQSSFIGTFAKNSLYSGQQYGLPFIASARALFYNKDLLKQAKIAGPPATWKQLLADAQKLQGLGNGTIGYGLPLGAEEAQAEWSIWMWSNGGDWKKGSQWTINSPKNIQTLSWLNDLANKYKVTEVNPGHTNRTDGVWALFSQGKVGLVMGSPGTFVGMLQKNPSLHYGITAVPSNGGPHVTLGVEDYLMAFKKPGNQAAVKAFLNFFYRSDNYAKFLTVEGFLPTTKSGSAALKSNPKFAPYLKLLGGARFYPSDDPAWPKVQGAVQQTLGTAVQGKSPASVLKQLQKVAQQASKS
jgi:multiple sugar transport system substrate-binding protein